jgi:hypothetical protein
MRFFLILCFLYIHTLSWAQLSFTFHQEINVEIGDKTIPLPFTGGINAAQIQTIDVNNDGNEEWIIWDINSRRLTVFSNTNENFNYHPEWSYQFPADINGFFILIDYDKDGRKDLFTSSPLGVRVYKNLGFGTNNTLQWQLISNFLPLENGGNVTVNNLDIPLLIDMDGDGDLDLLTFNFASGDFLEYYRNTSIERKGTPDIDQFAFPVRRWGNFEFCSCGQIAFGTTCSSNLKQINQDLENQKVAHAGGHSLLYEDFNGDGVRDILIGQDECNTLYFIPNKGSNEQPIFENFSTQLPQFGSLPNFPVFHTAMLWKDQLIISSNTSSAAFVHQSNFAQNIFALQPTSTGMSEKQPFLQKETLDLGENARPFFKGNVTGGKLIITSNTLEGNNVVGKAMLVDVLKGNWSIVDLDFLKLSQLNLWDLQYLEYTNSRGLATYWLSGVQRTSSNVVRRIQWGVKNDLSDLKEITVPGINLLPLDQIALFIYENEDYLLLARQTGELILYELNLQSTNPSLRLKERAFLDLRDNPAARNLTVEVIPGSKPSLYLINQRGTLMYVEDFMNNKKITSIEIQGTEQENHRLGRINWITHLSYPFSQEKDLLLGNIGGGLIYLKGKKQEGNLSEDPLNIQAYPNPSFGNFKVLSAFDGIGQLYNSLGQLIIKDITLKSFVESPFDLSKHGAGLYYLTVTHPTLGFRTLKILIR